MSVPPDATIPSQRLDQWLVNARFVKTRSLAAALVTAGAIRINRQATEKPHARLRPGDILTIAPPYPEQARVRVIEVRAITAKRGPASVAQTLYTEHAE
jgi:ribosome-associated heat shock protein Hsp15